MFATVCRNEKWSLWRHGLLVETEVAEAFADLFNIVLVFKFKTDYAF